MGPQFENNEMEGHLSESWLTYQVVTLRLESMRPTDIQTVFVENL